MWPFLRGGCQRSLEESPGDRPYVRSDTVTITGSYTTLLDSTPARTPRFVHTQTDGLVLDEAALARARRLVGLKGLVTNIPATVLPAAEVISSYADLWHVEHSFRMSKK